MKRASNYWQGIKPTNGTRWVYTDKAMVLDDPQLVEAVYRMHRRYAKQWNDIELDTSRSLSEHTHKVCGAQVVGGNRRFILHAHQENNEHWILEILFARGFSVWYPGWSFGKNSLRSTSDIKSIQLHWSQGGKEAFESWLKAERDTNQQNGEWNEYKAKAIGRQARNA